MPIRAQADRIFRVTVCLRPFRAAGPRLDVERVGEKTVVHNYGHGGSGWSLSWGSSSLAVEKAMAAGERNVAVIGCGALGLTSAILLQRAGARVTIYAKDRPPEVRSARATGSWTPDSRIALTKSAAPDFPALWERMARSSFRMFESYLGRAGNPVEWMDRYALSDASPAGAEAQPGREPSSPLEFARYQNRIADITPRAQDLPPGSHPFPVKFVRRNSSLTFNVAGYSRQLMTDFLVEGGRIESAEFHSPSDLSRIAEKVVISGQITWLIPQPEVTYGLQYRNLNIVPRRDGIVVQDIGGGDMTGYNDDNEQPDRAAAEAAVGVLAELTARTRWSHRG